MGKGVKRETALSRFTQFHNCRPPPVGTVGHEVLMGMGVDFVRRLVVFPNSLYHSLAIISSFANYLMTRGVFVLCLFPLRRRVTRDDVALHETGHYNIKRNSGWLLEQRGMSLKGVLIMIRQGSN